MSEISVAFCLVHCTAQTESNVDGICFVTYFTNEKLFSYFQTAGKRRNHCDFIKSVFFLIWRFHLDLESVTLVRLFLFNSEGITSEDDWFRLIS